MRTAIAGGYHGAGYTEGQGTSKPASGPFFPGVFGLVIWRAKSAGKSRREFDIPSLSDVGMAGRWAAVFRLRCETRQRVS
jgi:hypothetical protein